MAVYTSPYTSDISNVLKKLKNRSFSYDADSDEALQNAQDQAMGTVTRTGARKGMLFSDSTKQGMTQAASDLVPQYEQLAENRYNTETNNLYNRLNALNSQENTAYNKYRDTVSDDRYNAEQTGYYNPYSNVKADDSLKQYSGNYQARINELEATNPNDPTLIQLKALRAQKLFSDPELLQKYGSSFKTEAAQKQDKADYANTIGAYANDYQAQINNVQNDGDPSNDWQIPYLQSARNQKLTTQAQAQAQAEDTAYKRWMEEQKLSLDKAKTNYDINKPYYNPNSGGSSSGLNYKDYYNAGRQMLTKTYDNDNGNYRRAYSDYDIANWVDGLDLDDPLKIKLLNDLGVQDPESGAKSSILNALTKTFGGY